MHAYKRLALSFCLAIQCKLWLKPSPREGIRCSKTWTKIVGGPCLWSAMTKDIVTIKKQTNKQKKSKMWCYKLRDWWSNYF